MLLFYFLYLKKRKKVIITNLHPDPNIISLKITSATFLCGILCTKRAHEKVNAKRLLIILHVSSEIREYPVESWKDHTIYTLKLI